MNVYFYALTSKGNKAKFYAQCGTSETKEQAALNMCESCGLTFLELV